jgi:hypothetical protein
LLAVALAGAGIVRLQVPTLSPFDPLTQLAAWSLIATGGLCMAAFWITLLRRLGARNSAR